MTTTVDTHTVTPRDLWTLFEPIHSVTYFAPEAVTAFEDAGLEGFWQGYFAGRAAPFGKAPAEHVAAAFYSYAPHMVALALPAVWEVTAPERALEVRRAGAREALRRLLAGQEGAVERAAALLAPYARALDCAGRPLAGANAALPVPGGDEPFDLLWHAATLLREHRGDGHLAALVAADLDGCEVLVLRAGADLPRSELQPYRGWTDEEWDAAARRLTGRGLLDESGTTAAGRGLLDEVERATDRAAARAWPDLTPAVSAALLAALSPLAETVARTLRYPNPIGVPRPTV
ncbi:SCO6745 family protein [Streptomyces sp. NPDC055078]